MANTFKNAIKPNVTNIGSNYDDLYTAPAGTTSIILGLALANKTTSSVTVKVQVADASGSNPVIQLLEDVSIPANTTLEVLGGQKYVLEAGDILKVQAGTGTAIDAFLGVMERT